DRTALVERVVTNLLRLGERAVRRARHDLVRPDAVPQAIEHVAGDERLEQRDEELRLELEPRLLARGLAEPALLLEQHHAEPVEARVAQRLPVLGDVHAEAARPARPGRQEHVVFDDLPGGEALLVAQVDQELYEVADREIGRIALRAVTELL